MSLDKRIKVFCPRGYVALRRIMDAGTIARCAGLAAVEAGRQLASPPDPMLAAAWRIIDHVMGLDPRPMFFL